MSKELALLILSAMMLAKAGLYQIDDGGKLVSDLSELAEETKNFSLAEKTEQVVSALSFLLKQVPINEDLAELTDA